MASGEWRAGGAPHSILLPERAMAERTSSSRRRNRSKAESFFGFPRLLAVLGAIALAATPFLPWLESAREGDSLTLKEVTTRLVESGTISLNLWPVPIIVGVLFLLPLFTELRLTRGVYHLLLIEMLVLAALFFYPSLRALLFELGISVRVHVFRYGAYLFLGGMLLLALSAVLTLWESRLGVALLTLVAVFSAAIVAGSLTGWFGYLTGEPMMQHREYESRVPDGPALGVHLNVLNDGWGKMRVNLKPTEKPREADLIVSAQRYYRIGDYWADVPLDDLVTQDSKTLLPAEIAPGGVLVLDLVFGPLTSAGDLYSLRPPGASGLYRVWLSDPEGKRRYPHTIEVPPAAEPASVDTL